MGKKIMGGLFELPSTPDNYYNLHDPEKSFESILFRDGYVLQGRELNDLQELFFEHARGLGDALFADGDIIRDAQISVDASTGQVTAQAGAIYLAGKVRGVPPASFVIPTSGTVTVGIRLVLTVISENEDPALRNPAQGCDGEGEAGAWRLKVEALWGFDTDGGSGRFVPVHTVDNGVVRAKEQPPNQDSFTQGIARYDRDSTGGSGYVAEGMLLRFAEQTDDAQIYNLSEGRCRVYGYGVEVPTSRRLSYPARPDLRTIDTEVHVGDGTESQRIAVAHPPIHAVKKVNVIVEKSVELTHGSYAGCEDALPDTSVVALLEVKQGDTVYVSGDDYTKNGDKIDWSPAGDEPATGSSYQVKYTVMTQQVPDDVDADGFSVKNAVRDSNVLVTYEQALPRIDRLCVTQDGAFEWVQGVGNELAPKSPAVPATMLALASVTQAWRGAPAVVNDGVRVVPFADIQAINARLDYVMAEVARQRLEADATTREDGARVGMFVDPLLDDSMRDQGVSQTAAIVGGELCLPIAASAYMLSRDISVPKSRSYVPVVALAQTLRTNSMRVTPYSAFDPMPARVTLTPSIDRWTEYDTTWASPVTEKFDVSRDGYYHVVVGTETKTTTETLSSQSSALEFLREIDVAFEARDLEPGETVHEVTFDGMVMECRTAEGEPGTITADENGVARGVFTIPPNVPAGAKTVVVSAHSRQGQAVFVGQGTLTVQTLRQVKQVTTVWVDPLAQTFVAEEAMQLAGVDLYFTAAGGDAQVQIREVVNGVPTRVVFAEAHIAREDMVVTGGGHTRVLFDAPVALSANVEYALVVLCDDAETSLAIAVLGEYDELRKSYVTSQPYTIGVMLSSSNASTWTAHQDKDMAFRLLKADFTSAQAQEIDLGSVDTEEEATDMLLFGLSDLPTAKTSVQYAVDLPDGTTASMAEGQAVNFAKGQTGRFSVKASLSGDATASPVLYPGTMLVCGKVGTTADYCTRSITSSGAAKGVLIFDAIIPAGAAVTPKMREDEGEWQEMTKAGTVNQGDGLVEFRYELALSGGDMVKAKIELSGTATARPRVRNIRMLAVK